MVAEEGLMVNNNALVVIEPDVQGRDITTFIELGYRVWKFLIEDCHCEACLVIRMKWGSK